MTVMTFIWKKRHLCCFFSGSLSVFLLFALFDANCIFFAFSLPVLMRFVCFSRERLLMHFAWLGLISLSLCFFFYFLLFIYICPFFLALIALMVLRTVLPPCSLMLLSMANRAPQSTIFIPGSTHPASPSSLPSCHPQYYWLQVSSVL